MIKSIAGNENLEIQWRLATLKETKAVVTQYHKYLKENSLSNQNPTPKFFLRNLKTRAPSYGDSPEPGGRGTR